MNSSRVWLIIFAIVVSILVIATVSLVLLTKGNEVNILPDNTPQGIVQRYLVALQEKDYQKAYTFLSFDPSEKIQTYNDWLRMVIGGPQISNQSAWKAALGKTTQNGEGDNATVEVIIDTFRPGGPFEDPVRSQSIIFQLRKINDQWLITSPTYIFWIY
jgi:hypothetical protein